MCNISAEAIDAEIIDDLKHGKKVEPNEKYGGIVQAIVKTVKESFVVKDMPNIRGEWLCHRLSINEWNARKRREFENHRLFGRYGT